MKLVTQVRRVVVAMLCKLGIGYTVEGWVNGEPRFHECLRWADAVEWAGCYAMQGGALIYRGSWSRNEWLASVGIKWEC